MFSIKTHSLLLSQCVHSVQRTRRFDRIACCSVLLLPCDDGLMMVPNENASSEAVQSNVRSQHTAPQGFGLGSGRAPAEGYRYSVPSRMAIGTRSYCPGHPFIVVIEVRTAVQHTRCCVRNKCLLQLAGVSHFAPRTESANSCSLLDVGGREATLLL